MYYENFERLCKENNKKPADVCRGTGISSATLTSWKKGKYTPKQDKLSLIANFFNVSVDVVINGDNASIIEKDNNYGFDKRLVTYFNKLAQLSEDHIDKILHDIEYYTEQEKKTSEIKKEVGQ